MLKNPISFCLITAITTYIFIGYMLTSKDSAQVKLYMGKDGVELELIW